MKIEVGNITGELEEIRKRVGAELVEFVPRPSGERINADLTSVAQVERLFDRSGLLVHRNRPVFVYIRDHTFSQGTIKFPEGGKKIHFAVCSTLKEMQRTGRFPRYRMTENDNNLYLVDVREGSRYVERDVRLFPCQNCLGQLRYRCFDFSSPRDIKSKIVEEFDAREAFDFLSQHFDIFRQQMAGRPSATSPTGYPRDWNRISRDIRESCGFTCQGCGVKLKRSSHLLDVHHKDGDKRNNRDDNLICLCKLCHADQSAHGHYTLSSGERRLIGDLRKQQRL